ncbi:MAG TPA: zinc-dependent metalloprotease [Candidatus Limnocylindrales bacterium]|nr:zinc-dependent metalloprotease [Candidatus Limnocylindrales bacterium]
MTEQKGSGKAAGTGGGASGGGGEARRSRRTTRPAGGGWRSDRRWQAGFLLGSAIGAAATVLGRRAERAARRGLVDWGSVERIAIGRAAKAPGALSPLELRAADGAYREAMARVAPRLAEALGTQLPGVVERAAVVDRAGWIRANVGTFQSLISRMEDELLDQVVPEGGGLTRATMALANRWVTSQQLGYLLGFMGTRVLGQYDIALLSAEAEDGRLLFVEENIRGTAHALGIPVAPFRTWIALHETTHAFEFEAHPWLRPYIATRLERQLSMFSGNASNLGRDTLRAIGRTLRGEAGGEHWMESLMGEEQRRLFRETQAVMSLLEGFSDYVMDEVGRGLVEDVEKISARFHERRQRRSGFERAVLRLTGMDLKMEQYAKGERFVRAIAEARGRAALARIWDGPESLPSAEEIAEPERWIERVLPKGAASFA